MIGLWTAPHDRREGVTCPPDIPLADAGSLVGLDGDDLPGGGQEDLGAAIQVEIGDQPGCAPSGGGGDGIRGVFGGDELGVGREPHVAEVDAAEQPVPVAVIRLALVEVVPGGLAVGPGRHRVDLVGRPEHLLVEVVDLAIADLEVSPERAT